MKINEHANGLPVSRASRYNIAEWKSSHIVPPAQAAQTKDRRKELVGKEGDRGGNTEPGS